MKVSLNWLKEFVDIDLGVDELAHRLTMLGLEIESVERPGAEITKVVIGKILDIKPHPDADKLVVCQTDTGEANPLQIVCGAKNMKAGDLVPTAVLGATLPGGFAIGKRKMRGIESQGMMCSARELGLGKDHEGLLILPQDLPIGADAIPLLGLDDVIYEIEVTPNRGDWAGMIGVARELAAYFNRPLRLPDATVNESGAEAKSLTSVTIDASDLCARYIGRVATGIKPARTPLWMAQRLIHAGQRLVNPVVDITNYVLLETGHPLHAFDYDKLAEHRIVVRRACAGETIKTIDGEVRTLRDEMLVIADASNPIAIAGVMGGLDSEVGENTTRIILESAWFEPSSVRKTARTLAMNSEASQRFQRGADIEMAEFAANRAARLIHEITGAAIAPGAIDEYPRTRIDRTVNLRFARTNALLGTDISGDEQCSILNRLDFDTDKANEGTAEFRVPSWRHDVTREADLIEEIARLYGYENIPSTVPRVRKADTVFAPQEVATRRLRRYLASIGLTEHMGLTFSSLDEVRKSGVSVEKFNVVRLQNPLAETSSIMRVSLIPNLLELASLNLRRGVTQIKVFELGHVYHGVNGQAQPNEHARLGIVLSGLREVQHWGRERQALDIYDLKGVLESIFDDIGVTVTWGRSDSAAFDAGYSGTATYDPQEVARFGRVSSSVAKAYDLIQEVYLAEIDLDAVLKQTAEPRLFEAPSTFPPSLRDIAVVLDAAVPGLAVAEAAREAGGKLLRGVELFDIYTGKQVPAGKKSIALSLVFQSNEKTLTDKDTQKAWDNILKVLAQKFDATLR
ncbi:MAG: phenylalanine--tRNA ligase subunit beta [Candidatus Hydrogenedentes bacterium]|nr:phenylalanine--tRNA ligase subunit beta [Candidatus Hydrogenedentota bacterium]